VALKQSNPDLKVLIAIGGWTMNDPDYKPPNPYLMLFTEMVATQANRTLFIEQAIEFCATHGFDGVDIDWEYPGRTDRGGRTSDKAGLVALVQEFKAAAPHLLLTMAVPASAYSWGGYDLPALTPHVDFFNLMTYDYHGSWESNVGFNTPWVDSTSSIDISRILKHYIETSGVPANKVVLGLGAYGRSWTLSTPDATAGIGTAASEAGVVGRCTGQPGYLGWREIRENMETRGARVTIDTTAMAAFAVDLTDKTQWFSFDLPQTLYMKIQKAEEMGLGGLMVGTGVPLDAASQPLRWPSFAKEIAL
jgi:chitinase